MPLERVDFASFERGVYDRALAEDMMKNAVIIASFVYHAANRDALLRKARPGPRPR